MHLMIRVIMLIRYRYYSLCSSSLSGRPGCAPRHYSRAYLRAKTQSNAVCATVSSPTWMPGPAEAVAEDQKPSVGAHQHKAPNRRTKPHRAQAIQHRYSGRSGLSHEPGQDRQISLHVYSK